YVLALHLPWLQGHAETGDYLIGATLFFFATMLLFAAIRRWSPGGSLQLPPVRVGHARQPRTQSVPRGLVIWSRLALLGALVLLGSAGYVRAMLAPQPPTLQPGQQVRFPAAIGRYRLRRTWPEKLDTGQTIFEWAEYGRPGQDAVVAVGVSPVLGAHDTLLCHVARGEQWLWHGTLPLATAKGTVPFSGSYFNDGATEYLEATTVCTGFTCGQWTSPRTHFGLVYSRPGTRDLLGGAPTPPVPVLLRAETPDASLPAEVGRQQLTARLQDFAGDVSFGDLTDLDRRP
ncbi:MAG TPA: exosortase J, partial [Acidobacteriaceae bacterium]|nr:exosortase J [Acidobacteriaceae bacterium]